jgi:hypothetical protein
VLNCFTFFVFTSFVFMKIFQDSTTSIINYYFIYMYLLQYFTKSTTQLKHVLVYEDATREDILSRYPWSSLLSGISILSYRSVPYFCTDSGSGFLTVIMGADCMYLVWIMSCMYLVWIDLDLINTCNLNASIHI